MHAPTWSLPDSFYRLTNASARKLLDPRPGPRDPNDEWGRALVHGLRLEDDTDRRRATKTESFGRGILTNALRSQLNRGEGCILNKHRTCSWSRELRASRRLDVRANGSSHGGAHLIGSFRLEGSIEGPTLSKEASRLRCASSSRRASLVATYMLPI